MEDKRVNPCTIRLPSRLKTQLDKIAENKGTHFSCLVRAILEEWLKHETLNSKELLWTHAMAEMVYMLRGVSDQVNPALKDGAKQHAKEVLEKLTEKGMT